MDTISDYIRWLGDFPVSATGLREPDAVLFCLLSYIDFTPAFQGREGGVRVSECLPFVENDQLSVLSTGDGREYLKILKVTCQSKRYGDILLRNYQNLQRDDPPLQFSAVCFEDKEYSFIAFRGTDSSLAGWKEDFMISFTRTEAQELALAYAENCICPGRRWYLGGHSKGGNELLYAAALLPEDQWNLVDRIFLLDGPGLCPEVMDSGSVRDIDSKTTCIVPEFSVIGKLFEPRITDSRIVRSSAQGLTQHVLTSWGIDHGKLAEAEDNDSLSKWINEILEQWIGGVSQEERPILVNELFAALSAGGAKDLHDLTKDGTEGLEAIFKQLKTVSETTKKAMGDLPKQAFRYGVDQFRQAIGAGVQSPDDKKRL